MDEYRGHASEMLPPAARRPIDLGSSHGGERWSNQGIDWSVDFFAVRVVVAPEDGISQQFLRLVERQSRGGGFLDLAAGGSSKLSILSALKTKDALPPS